MAQVCRLSKAEDGFRHAHGGNRGRNVVHPHDPRSLGDANDGHSQRTVQAFVPFPIQRLADEILV